MITENMILINKIDQNIKIITEKNIWSKRVLLKNPKTEKA